MANDPLDFLDDPDINLPPRRPANPHYVPGKPRMVVTPDEIGNGEPSPYDRHREFVKAHLDRMPLIKRLMVIFTFVWLGAMTLIGGVSFLSAFNAYAAHGEAMFGLALVGGAIAAGCLCTPPYAVAMWTLFVLWFANRDSK